MAKISKKQFIKNVVAACKKAQPHEEHKNGYRNVTAFMIDEGILKPSTSIRRATEVVLDWCNDCAA